MKTQRDAAATAIQLHEEAAAAHDRAAADETPASHTTSALAELASQNTHPEHNAASQLHNTGLIAAEISAEEGWTAEAHRETAACHRHDAAQIRAAQS